MWTKWDKKCWVWTSNGNWTRNRPKGSKIVLKWNKMHLDGRKLSSAVHPEFHLSMTKSSGFIREGSGSTFEVCQAHLKPFWLLLTLLWVPKLLMKSGYLSKSWISTFYDQQFWIYKRREWQHFWRVPCPSDALLISPTLLWVPKLLIKSGYLSKSWISTFYDQQFWIYKRGEWQHFWSVPCPSDALLIAPTLLWVPKLHMKSDYLSKSWISTWNHQHQQFWIYRIRA